MEYDLRGETFNAYGAAWLYGTSAGGDLVVMETGDDQIFRQAIVTVADAPSNREFFGRCGATEQDKGRYKGIDHIVFVLRDPHSGELMVSQSRSREGVELLSLDGYLAHKHKRGTKLFCQRSIGRGALFTAV